MTMKEKFVLMDKFRLHGKLYREIAYKAAFVFRNETTEILKVVDVKGVLTTEFIIKAKLLANRYGIPITN